jgi:hypothetical protein
MSDTVSTSTMLNDQSLMRIALGFAIGATVTGFVGFTALGWTLESKAKDMAKSTANAAVVEALAPICAEKFQTGSDASRNTVALAKINATEQAAFIVQGGWAKFPGNSSNNTIQDAAVADACARKISAPK